jgi:DNA-binding CsgD family transcriptional regulator
VPSPAGWTQTGLPKALDGDQVAALLASCDPRTRTGRRDLAPHRWHEALDALLESGRAQPRRPALAGAPSLTAAERRVSQLASEGLSNREIAQALFVTVKTVELQLTKRRSPAVAGYRPRSARPTDRPPSRSAAKNWGHRTGRTLSSPALRTRTLDIRPGELRQRNRAAPPQPPGPRPW